MTDAVETMRKTATTTASPEALSAQILIPITPEYCLKLFNQIGVSVRGTPIYEKVMELRKTRPNAETPLKCLVYATQPQREALIKRDDKLALITRREYATTKNAVMLSGKIIGEFICSNIEDFKKWKYDYYALLRHIKLFAATNYDFISKYLNGEKSGFGWFVTTPILYDRPKELASVGVKRAPQSWCYINRRDKK